MTTREQIRAALTTLLDPTLPLVHADDNPNCGECWECIGGTMGVARAMRRSGADVSGALAVGDALVYLHSDLAQAQGEVQALRALLIEARECEGLQEWMDIEPRLIDRIDAHFQVYPPITPILCRPRSVASGDALWPSPISR